MTAYLAIREDDISYFTDIGMVKKVHQKAIDMGFKMSFAVIPQIECSMDACVPPVYRRSDDKKYIGGDIVRFIKEIGGDVLLHGFSHPFGFPEFRETDSDIIRFKIETGRKLLRAKFGVLPKVFVPPQEDISKEAWKVLADEQMNICRTLSFVGWMRKTPLQHIPFRCNIRHLAKHPSFIYKRQAVRPHIHRIGNLLEFQTSAGFCTLRSSEIELRRAIHALDEAVRKDDLCQIAMHSWEFFNDWNLEEPRKDLLDAYHAFLEYASTCDICPVSLTEMGWRGVG